jgi:DNA-binding transcriptional LysR family regulator
LFERVGRGLGLTQKGEALVPRVAAVIEEYGRFREAVGDSGLHLGTLRLGSTETFALACLPAFMRAISSRYSGLQLECIVRTSAELEQGVQSRHSIASFSPGPRPPRLYEMK